MAFMFALKYEIKKTYLCLDNLNVFRRMKVIINIVYIKNYL